jgi:hypothetical protein
MKIKIPRIVRPLALSEYAPEYGDLALQVWLNPSGELIDAQDKRFARVRELTKQLEDINPLADGSSDRVREIDAELTQLGQETMTWLVKIWGQGAPETRMSIDELTEFVKSLASDGENSDPMLYGWLVGKTWGRIIEFTKAKKKS